MPKHRKYCVEIACPKCGLKWLVSDTIDVNFGCKCGYRIVHRVPQEKQEKLIFKERGLEQG